MSCGSRSAGVPVAPAIGDVIGEVLSVSIPRDYAPPRGDVTDEHETLSVRSPRTRRVFETARIEQRQIGVDRKGRFGAKIIVLDGAPQRGAGQRRRPHPASALRKAAGSTNMANFEHQSLGPAPRRSNARNITQRDCRRGRFDRQPRQLIERERRCSTPPVSFSVSTRTTGPRRALYDSGVRSSARRVREQIVRAADLPDDFRRETNEGNIFGSVSIGCETKSKGFAALNNVFPRPNIRSTVPTRMSR